MQADYIKLINNKNIEYELREACNKMVQAFSFSPGKPLKLNFAIAKAIYVYMAMHLGRYPGRTFA
jgi:hypothetical protein